VCDRWQRLDRKQTVAVASHNTTPGKHGSASSPQVYFAMYPWPSLNLLQRKLEKVTTGAATHNLHEELWTLSTTLGRVERSVGGLDLGIHEARDLA